MPIFDPNIPAEDSEMKSKEMRDQLNGLKELIDAVPVPPPETDPVFAASEAALLEPGDKPKIDTAVQPGTDILQLVPPTPTPGTFKFLVTDSAGGTTLEFVGPDSIDAGDLVYTATNPGHWAGSSPATIGAAIDRLAAAVSTNGANPIP